MWLSLLLVVPIAHADPDPAHAEHAAPIYDYSRFSDGPRAVPVPRGASLRRMQALGLGTRDVASRLLTGAPTDRWTSAAGWRARWSGERSPRLGLEFPIPGARIGRGFGFTRTERRDLRHNGLDIGSPIGTEIYAVADGLVAYSDNGIRGYGNCVLIVHANGWVSLYAHLSRATVPPGYRVASGERIGFVGQTGIARGPHLHFELRVGGDPVDPAPFFAGGRAEPAIEAEIGSVALAQALLRRPVSDELAASAAERTFSNLLLPLRGGSVGRRHRSSVEVVAPELAAVRASADGTVAYAGRLGRHGNAIVVVHRNGWVTLYANVDEIAVEPGRRIARGEWMGRARALRFELVDAGRPRDPVPLFAGRP
jgi:murein DD-endopeptidase MepM/ murein hydrolase activator NlpD